MSNRALITGVLGQDGAYLAKLLLEEGSEVYGGARRSSTLDTWRLEELGVLEHVHMVDMDLQEVTNVLRVIRDVKPDEVYNLAAQSFVGVSFEQPLLTSDVDAFGAVRVLEALRTLRPEARFYQASTSEMYGRVREVPQNERTPFHPRSPYAAAKTYAHYMTVNYRESYGMHTSSGILFNHESPLRGPEFVTRKITLALARICHGQQDVLELGNLDARRDWGFAGDYVVGMRRMLAQPSGGDYVLSTGKNYSVRQFVDRAAQVVGLDLEWNGEAESTVAVDRSTGRTVVRVNPAHYRPAEVDALLGDAAKAARDLGWKPVVEFDQLVEMIMRADFDRIAAVRD